MIDDGTIQSVNVDFGSNTEYAIKKIRAKFQIFDKAFVIREQFPLCLSYAVTIHKRQGLSLHNLIINAGNTHFNVGQSYVAFSRATKIEGLHLINFDPYSIKANSAAIEEYDRLRQSYKFDFPVILISKKRWTKVFDMIWRTEEYHVLIEHKNNKKPLCSDLLSIHGIENSDGVSCGINSVVQCIFHTKILRASLESKSKSMNQNTDLQKLLNIYITSKVIFSSIVIKQSKLKKLTFNTEEYPSKILTPLCDENDDTRTLVEYKLIQTNRRGACNYTNLYKILDYTWSLEISDKNNTYNLPELIDKSYGSWFDNFKFCSDCKAETKTKSKISFSSFQEVIIIKMSVSHTRNSNIITKKGFVKSVLFSKVILCYTSYHLVSAIFYFHRNMELNTHNAVIKNNSTWIEIDDLKYKTIRWPKSAIFFIKLAIKLSPNSGRKFRHFQLSNYCQFSAKLALRIGQN